jgi:hypothetical protein
MTEDEKKQKLILWATIRHFVFQEFSDPSDEDSGLLMNIELVKIVDAIREKCGFPFTITSGYRTQIHNTLVGGVEGSAHEAGLACDIAVNSGSERDAILKYSYALGIKRRGIGETLIHLDLDFTKPQDVCWLYKGK